MGKTLCIEEAVEVWYSVLFVIFILSTSWIGISWLSAEIIIFSVDWGAFFFFFFFFNSRWERTSMLCGFEFLKWWRVVYVKHTDIAATTIVSVEDLNAGAQHLVAANHAKHLTAANHAKPLTATYHANHSITNAIKGNISSQPLKNPHATPSHAYHLIMRGTKLMLDIKGNSPRLKSPSLHLPDSSSFLDYSRDPHTIWIVVHLRKD
jgi:hypothetical protein